MMRAGALTLLLLATSVLPAQGSDPERERERTTPRIRFTTALEEVVVVADGGSAEKALAAYEAPGAMTQQKMAAIYAAAGQGATAFKKVAWLIGQGKISAEDSVAMARIREGLIEGLITGIGQEKKWRIARSDSGNVTSGMKSDLDQTFYVFEVVETADGVVHRRAPELDRAFIDEFNRRWQDTHGRTGLSLEALDIASIEGRNRFPDVRVESVEGFWTENRRTSEALRNTPGAYTYPGAVGHQMQFRAFQAILDRNPRAFQTYGPRDPTDPDSRWVRRKGTKDEAVATMFGRDPELRPGWAFDAALANFLELVHYLEAAKFESKYHLRTFEDALWSKILADRGQGRADKDELVDLEPEERRKIRDEALERLFPGDDEAAVARRRLHAEVMEVSVALRLQHKGEGHIERIAAFGGTVPASAERQRELIFERLGRELYGEEWGRGADRAQQLADVDARYRRLALEFCLETAYDTSRESFALLLSEDGGRHLDVERYRSLLKVESDADWARTRENLRSAAHLTFLYGIYELGVGKSLELVRRLRADFGDRHVPRLLALWMRGRLQGLEGPIREQGFRRFFQGQLERRLPAVAERVQSHVLSELGFENRAVVDAVTGEIRGARLHWELGKVARNMAYDPGHLDALAQIVRVYFESKGDPEAVKRAIADEFLLAIPVLGQIVGATRGGLTGLVAMGAAMAHPAVGGVLIAVGIGQAGLAIWDVEVARPMQANAVAAVYRGFIGPETRRFDGVPAQFTDADAERLETLQRRLEEARPPSPGFVRLYDRASVEAFLAERRRIEAPYHALKRELEPEIAALRAKRSAWEVFRDDPAYGGYFTAAGARLAQEPFENHLLAAIPPIVSYSPYGLVDFEVRQDETELERLREAMAAATTWEEALRAESAYRAARQRHDEMLRAGRWRARATGGGDADATLSPEEARMGLAELRYKLRRDSLYPGLRRLGYSDPDAFVDAWFDGNGAVLEELVAKQLCTPDSGESYWVPSYPEHHLVFTELSRFPPRYLEALKQRVREDFERSKALWEELEERRKAWVLKAEQDLQIRLQCFEAAAAGEAVAGLLAGDAAPGLASLYDAMREGVAPPQAPEIRTAVYRRPVAEGSPRRRLGDDGYAVDFALRVDPVRFGPPYSSELRALDAEGVRAAVRAGNAGGIPLVPSTVEALGQALRRNPPPEGAPDRRDFFLVSLFAGAGDEALGAPRVGDRFLVGQAVHLGVSEPAEEPPPPAAVSDVWLLSHRSATGAEWPPAWAAVRSRFPGALDHWRPEPPRARYPVVRFPANLRPDTIRLDLRELPKQIAHHRARSRAEPLRPLVRDQRYQLSTHAEITCNGQTMHHYLMRVGPYLEAAGSYLFVGLRNGEHRVRAVVTTEEGDRVEGAFVVTVALKEENSGHRRKRETAERRLASARDSARNPLSGPVTWARLADRIVEVGHLRLARGASREDLEGLIREACALAKKAGIGGRDKPLEPWKRMQLVANIGELAKEVSSPAVLAALEAAFKDVGPVGAKDPRDFEARVHDILSNLVVACRNDLEGGLRLRLRAIELRRMRRPDYRAKDYGWWPKPEQFRSR